MSIHLHRNLNDSLDFIEKIQEENPATIVMNNPNRKESLIFYNVFFRPNVVGNRPSKIRFYGNKENIYYDKRGEIEKKGLLDFFEDGKDSNFLGIEIDPSLLLMISCYV